MYIVFTHVELFKNNSLKIMKTQWYLNVLSGTWTQSGFYDLSIFNFRDSG